jgi:hypothetical protein
MAIEKVIDIKVQGNADQAVGSLRSQLREAQAEVAALSDKFGATSQAAIDAAKKAGELKDRIGDAKALTDAFNPDAKFRSLTASLSGVAGGFAAVQGGMALFGAESENVQATLLKVQSAMALSQGIQALGEARDSFRQLGAVANDVFKSIKAAIGSTGIGLLVVALATVVTYWDEIAEAIDGATDESKAYKAVQDQVTASIAKVEENLISVKIAIDQAKAGTISKEAALKKYNETLGTAFGKTDDLRVAEERMIANTENYVKAQTLRAAGNLMIAKGAEAAAKAASGEDKDLSFWQQAQSEILGTISISEKYASRAKSEIQNRVENAKEQAKYTTLGTNLLNEAAELEVKIGAEKNNKIYEQNQKRTTESEDLEQKAKEKRIADYEKDKAETIKQSEEIDELTYNFRKGTIDKIALLNTESIAAKLKEDQIVSEKEKENSDARVKLAEAEAAAKEALMSKTASVLSKGADLLGKNTAASKAMSIAAATINTYQGITAELATKTVTPFEIGLKIANVAIIAATGFKAVKDIISVKVPGGGGGGAAPNMGTMPGGGGATAPQFNVVGSTGVNQLAGVMGAQQQTPVQAYVVANNVTTAQGLDRNIIQSATLGG